MQGEFFAAKPLAAGRRYSSTSTQRMICCIIVRVQLVTATFMFLTYSYIHITSTHPGVSFDMMYCCLLFVGSTEPCTYIHIMYFVHMRFIFFCHTCTSTRTAAVLTNVTTRGVHGFISCIHYCLELDTTMLHMTPRSSVFAFP